MRCPGRWWRASEVFSSRTGLDRGDRFVAVIDGHRVDLPIVGIMRDYRTKGGMIFADYRVFGVDDPAGATWSGVRFFFRDRSGELERPRQLNTLIAVAPGRVQIRAMIFWEALLLTAAGEALGLACGFALSWLLVYVINYQSFGWTFIYAVDWGMLGLSVPLIAGAALGAAIPAVRAAFREPVAMVLRGR